MDILTGRPNHIEDFLVTVRTGQWFGWSNSSKVYANLIIHDDTKTKPTEKSLTDDVVSVDALNEELKTIIYSVLKPLAKTFLAPHSSKQ